MNTGTTNNSASGKGDSFHTAFIVQLDPLLPHLGDSGPSTDWFARFLFTRGSHVVSIIRIAEMREDYLQILQWAHKREIGDLFVLGGEVPHGIDQLLTWNCRYYNIERKINHALLKQLARRYMQVYEAGLIEHPKMTRERRRMASIPHHCQVFSNSLGLRPGYYFPFASPSIWCLPDGTPELEAMAAQISTLLDTRNELRFYTRDLETTVRDSVLLAGFTKELKKRFPGLQVAYTLTDPANRNPMRVRLRYPAAEKDDADTLLDRAEDFFYHGSIKSNHIGSGEVT